MSGEIVTEGETILIYADKQKSFLGALARSAVVSFVLPLLIIDLMYLPSFLNSLFERSYQSPSISAPLMLCVCLGVFIIVFSNLVITALELNDLPAVVLSHEGLTVCNGLLKIGPIPWDEIEKTRIIEREHGNWVGIIPHDTNRLCKRLGGSATWLMLRGFFRTPFLVVFQWYDELLSLVRIPKTYRLTSLISTPIVISDTHLPLSADELAARIRAYQTTLPITPRP